MRNEVLVNNLIFRITFSKITELSEYLYVSTLYDSSGVKIHEDVLVPDFLFEVRDGSGFFSIFAVKGGVGT